MSTHLSPEMVALFDTYGEGPRSIGADLTRAIKAASTNDPLVVAAGPEMALYPGSAQGPSAQRFDICTKGGKELSGVANLGAALGSLVNLHALDVSDDLWRLDAERLLGVTRAAREVNSFELWRDTIAVEAFRGREKAIATMQDYGCALAIRYLEAILADQTLLTVEFLRKEVLEAPGPVLGGTIPTVRRQHRCIFDRADYLCSRRQQAVAGQTFHRATRHNFCCRSLRPGSPNRRNHATSLGKHQGYVRSWLHHVCGLSDPRDRSRRHIAGFVSSTHFHSD
jgi:hypothetical protein